MQQNNDKFKLSDKFLENYKGKQPNWGFGTLSYFTYKRTYSRLMDDGTQEEFYDTIKRCVEGSFTIQLRHCKNSHLPWDAYRAQKSAQVMFKKMWEFKFLPPGRGLWIMGTPIVDKIGSAALNNCATTSTKDIDKDFAEPFAWAADMLMLGVGVGYDTLGAGKVEIPHNVSSSFSTYTIPDTREGWVEAIRVLLNNYANATHGILDFDYSLIRPAGSPIKGFGGTASGPEPLREGIESISKLLNSYQGKKLDSVGIVDIMNYIGKFVVAGNVRRSAELALGSIDDMPFITMKDYNLYPNEVTDRRWMSNNSVTSFADSDFSHIIKNIALNGEPGLVFLDTCRKFGRLKDGERNSRHPKYDNCVGVNPCVTSDTWIMTKSGPFQVKDLPGIRAQKDKYRYTVDGSHHNGTGFWSNGIKPVYKLQTEQGYELKLTYDHKILTTNGWKEAGDLDYGDKIVLNNHRAHINWPATGNETLDEGYLLGHLIGDGTFGPTKAILEVWEDDTDSERSMMHYISNIADNMKARSDFIGWTSVYREDNLVSWRMSLKSLTDLASRYGITKSNKVVTEEVQKTSSEFYKGFLAGLFDTDGSVQGSQTKGVSIRLAQVNRNNLVEVQRMLLRLGIKSTIYKRKEACVRQLPDANRNPKDYPCQELFELIIANDNIALFKELIPLKHSAKVSKLDSLVAGYSRKLNTTKFVADFKSLEYIGDEEVFDATVETVHRFDANGITAHNCSEMTLHDKEMCCLVETFPANHENSVEFCETLKYAYLYAKSVTLVPTHCEKTNQVMLQNRRIGTSQSGIQQAIKKFGIQRYLTDFCDRGYEILDYWDTIYSRWLGVPTSLKISTIKPSGTISLLAGATPGVHCTHSEYYMRTVRVAANSPLVPKLRQANYRIEESVTDKNTLVVYFPVKESNFTKSKYDISLWEQLTLVKELQHYWSDNAVSATVTFKPQEVGDLQSAIEYFAPYVKALSFLPLDNHNYPQAPYQTCTEKEYTDYVNSLKELDLSNGKEESKGEKYCTNDSCSI